MKGRPPASESLFACLVLACLIVAVLRFFQPTQPITWPATCKDAAHILVGLLLGLAIVARSWACGGLLAAMTVVEAYAFFTTARSDANRFSTAASVSAS